MGLDMYAHRIRAELVNYEPEVDVKLSEIARRSVGFVDLFNFEFERLDKEGKRRYLEKQRDAVNRAKEEWGLDYDFYYWRKFNALHGWMEKLYRVKGGTDPDFNCNNVRLHKKDLERLEDEINDLQPTSGFFFGAEEIYPEHVKSLREFLKKANAAIDDGYAVFYDSWW